jgi:hypothetical protein
MLRFFAFLAAGCLLAASVGCHPVVLGICDCDSCMYGCCGYYPCCPPGAPHGTVVDTAAEGAPTETLKNMPKPIPMENEPPK